MLTLLSLTACVLTMVSSYLLARGRLKAVYVIGIFNGISYVVINLALGSKGGDQAAVVLLAIPSAWAVLCNGMGLRRLKRAKLSSQKGE